MRSISSRLAAWMSRSNRKINHRKINHRKINHRKINHRKINHRKINRPEASSKRGADRSLAKWES